VVVAIGIAIAAPYLAPIALGALGITATATAVAIATAVIGLALSVAASLAFRALGVGAPQAKSATGPPTVFRQTITDSFIVYGKRRVGGLLVFFHPKKVGADHFRYFVIACAGHRCKGVVTWHLNDETVTVDGSNKVTTGKYAGAAWLWFQRGLATETANATFVSECGSKWTSDHRGDGIAAIYAKFKLTDDVVEAGMPNITAVIEGRDEIRDPRDGTTGYSRNGPMIFYDWMQIPREEGGFGAYADEIPDDVWQSAQANVADETVNGESRYAIDAVLTTGAAPAEVRDALTVNMAGSYTFSGGKHLMRPGYWVPVSATLSEHDLAAAIQVSPFMPSDAAANQVQGTYISATDGYQGMPFETQSVAASDIRQLDLDLAFTTNPDQAARVAAIMLKRAQAEKTVVWPMNIAGLKVKALDTVQLASSRYGLDNYAWTVVNWGLSADFGVVLQLREENEEIYADGSAVAPPTVPDLDVATPVLKTSEIAELISTSSVIDPDPTTAVLRATETTISVDDHIRRYSDFQVEVYGSAGSSLRLEDGDDLLLESGAFMLMDPASSPDITGLTAGTQYHVGYDDLARGGGAVTYIASTRLTDVSNPGVGGVSPGMHYVGTITTAALGSGGTNTGGGAVPPGYNGLGAIP
jgi:hypothetical protein